MDLYLKNIKLLQFKNYDSLQSLFHPRINLITGLNGSGKTNILDAVYYLAFCKSAYSATDLTNIQHGQNLMRLEGDFSFDGRTKNLVAKIVKGKRKEFILDENAYTRLAEHIGLIPLVLICPDDIQLVKGHSDERRKLLDSHIAQFDHSYLLHLLKYNKSLKQRNALLKTWAKKGVGDSSLIKGYDEILIESGQVIYERRKDFVEKLIDDFSMSYEMLANKSEPVGLTYKSVLENASMRDVIDENASIDRMMQRTTQGIHRDDLTFEIFEHPLKKTGSQGQQKSFMVALKLAMYYFLKRQKELKPILLLDDIFDKLDGERMNQLLSIVSDDAFGQVFITDTHPTRLSERLDNMEVDYQQLEIAEGKILATSSELES